MRCQECNELSKYRGLCARHYYKQYYQNLSEEQKEKRRICERRWRLNNIKKKRKYYEENKDRRNKQYKERRRKDVNFKIAFILRNRILFALRQSGEEKSNSTFNLVGCNIDEFRQYIESLFQDGMSWVNHGVHGWHIDHIKPISSFDLSIDEKQKECFHYSNLQPLWAEENLKKGGKVM